MIIKNTIKSYGLITIALHWIMAIIIIGLFILGEYMVDLDYYDQWYQLAPWWHKSFGLSILMLLAIRFFWKLTNITPESLASYKAWEIKSSKIVHILDQCSPIISTLGTNRAMSIAIKLVSDLPVNTALLTDRIVDEHIRAILA